MRSDRKVTEFGKAIRKRLIDLDMNQTDLARRIGTSKVTITYIIHGDRNPGRWEAAIREILGLSSAEDEKGA